jgi:hypothetical protein
MISLTRSARLPCPATLLAPLVAFLAIRTILYPAAFSAVRNRSAKVRMALTYFCDSSTTSCSVLTVAFRLSVSVKK